MIKPLTSLRFFFAAMVFLSHLRVTPADSESLASLHHRFFNEGYIGVSFFYILSGFILSLNYTGKLQHKTLSNVDFWVARIAKIYPMHLLTLIIALPLTIPGLLSSPMLWAAKLLTNTLLLQSFIPLSDFFFSFNIPSWSISDEMFFYLLFPFIITILLKYPKSMYAGIAFLAIIPLAIALSPAALEHRFFYIHPIFRLADFILGILLFNLYKLHYPNKGVFTKWPATFIEITSIGIFILFFAFHHSTPQGYRFSCYYWLPMAAIILAFSYQAGYVSVLLSKMVFVVAGKISFSFYLIHHLLIRYITAINTKLAIIDNQYILYALIFTLSLLASYALYTLFEFPCNTRIKTIYHKYKAGRIRS